MRIEDFRRERVRVSRFSTIRAAENTYSVSSRLIGEEVDLRLHAESIEIWHGEERVATIERQRVRILHLAASTSQAGVEAALDALIERGELRDYAQVRLAAAPEPVEVPQCAIEPPDLSAYDAITAAGGEQ
jgi:hypothetical protein